MFSRKLLLFTASAAAAIGTLFAQVPCSVDTITGTYALRVEFTTPAGAQRVPTAGVELTVASINPDGTVLLTGNRVVGGEVSPREAHGSVTVASDCTAVLRSAEGSVQLLILDNGESINSVFLQSPSAPVTSSGVWKRISRLPLDLMKMWSPCSAEMVFGTYGFMDTGFVYLPSQGGMTQVPQVALGIGHRFSDGTFHGNFRVSRNGNSNGLEFESTGFTVNPDCTGTFNWRVLGVPGGIIQERLLIVDRGNEMWSMCVNSGVPTQKRVSISIHKRISPVAAQ